MRGSQMIFTMMITVSRRLRMTGQMTKIGLAASAISIIASIYIYFSHDGGDPMLGIFVGLWAPTLILYAQELDKMND